MLKGMIAIFANNMYLPEGTYVRITKEEVSNRHICEKYEPHIPTPIGIDNYLVFISFEHGILTGSNQTYSMNNILQYHIQELEQLHWKRFQIIPMMNQYGIYVPIFQLLDD